MEMVHAVIGLAVLQFFIFGGFVGRARVKSGVEAPAVTGDPVFERYYRVHYNTMEQLIMFIPALLLFAIYIDTLWASILGLVYLVGRVIYFRSYIKEPAKRGAGYGVSVLPIIILLLGGLGGAVMSALGS
jgi:glutathione S-transferase